MTAERTELRASTDLVVGGMTCAACVNRVEKRLARIEGVSATVNLATGRARVSHPSDVTAQDLVTAIERAGYSAELPAPPRPAHEPSPPAGTGRPPAARRSGGC